MSAFDEFGGTYIERIILSNLQNVKPAETITYNWEIPSTADTPLAPGKYLIRVSAYSYDKSKSYEDSSDAPFTISASQLPDLTVTKFSVYRIDSSNVGDDYCIKNIGNTDAGEFSIAFSNQNNLSWNFGGAGFNSLAVGQEYCGKGSRSGVGSNGGNGYVSGDNKIVIFIDPNDIIQESNEDNNEEAYALIRLSRQQLL